MIRLRQRGQWAESLPLLQQYLRIDPDDASALQDLGVTWLHLKKLPAAITSLRRATAVKPDLAIAHYHLAVALQQDDREAEAITALRRAVSLAPRHAEAQAMRGDLLLLDGQREEAAACFRRAFAASPNATPGRLSLAKAFIAEENFHDAERQLRRTIALDPNSNSAHWTLGRTLTRLGRFADAATELEHAIALGPDDVFVYHDLVVTKRVGEADRPMLAVMLAALDRPGLAPVHRILLEYALGKAFDDLGEYDGAIRHFDEANRLRGRALRFDRAAFAAENDRVMARFSSCRQPSGDHKGADDQTPILIVGMPRSGTTLVEQILSAHPEIGAAGEQNFWNDAAIPFILDRPDMLMAVDFGKAAGDYLALLRRHAPGRSRVTEKMPANFRWLGLVHATFPRARMIHCRRHPIDTCLSNYFTYFSRAQAHTCRRADLVFYYREYLRLMEHWRAIVPPECLLEIHYEALVTDREEMTRTLIAFAGLAWDEACLNPERNDRVVQTASTWQARQPVYRTSVERWRHYEPWLGELRELLPASSAAD
ncbi:MAG: tetratricopeptide repeat-containing sulfotransferase family protein [Acetobacteraceae bacterium]